jgi:hypothetical protein
MKTTKIFFTTLALGVLLTACWSSKHTTSQKQSSGKADTTAITNVVNKDTATVDSLTWYAGPLPVFESMEEFEKYLTRQKNIIRKSPIREYNQPDKVYVKNEDGTLSIYYDDSRTYYYNQLNIDSIPLILKKKIKNVEFYNLMRNASVGYENIQPVASGIICRKNSKNYLLPVDLNPLLSEDTIEDFTINEKIELFISTYIGLNKKYIINEILKKEVEMYNVKSDYQVVFTSDNITYYANLVIANKKFKEIFIHRANESKYQVFNFNE